MTFINIHFHCVILPVVGVTKPIASVPIFFNFFQHCQNTHQQLNITFIFDKCEFARLKILLTEKLMNRAMVNPTRCLVHTHGLNWGRQSGCSQKECDLRQQWRSLSRIWSNMFGSPWIVLFYFGNMKCSYFVLPFFTDTIYSDHGIYQHSVPFSKHSFSFFTHALPFSGIHHRASLVWHILIWYNWGRQSGTSQENKDYIPQEQSSVSQ